MRLLAHVAEAVVSDGGVDGAIAAVPMLADKNTALRHWSRTALFGPDARVRWVEPDLRPLLF